MHHSYINKQLLYPTPRQDLLGPSNPLKLLATTDPAPDTDSDLLLAHMLQLEFDREHDHMLTAEEKHHNKHNRGGWVGCIWNKCIVPVRVILGYITSMYMS